MLCTPAGIDIAPAVAGCSPFSVRLLPDSESNPFLGSHPGTKLNIESIPQNVDKSKKAPLVRGLGGTPAGIRTPDQVIKSSSVCSITR